MRALGNRILRIWQAARPFLAVLAALVLLGTALYIGDPLWWVLSCFALVVVIYGIVYNVNFIMSVGIIGLGFILDILFY